jgi:hypothetical protein
MSWPRRRAPDEIAAALLGAFATEPTAIGPQALVPGVAPIDARARLQMRADAPLEPKRPQRACDLGLFDEAARNQLDLFLHTEVQP